MTQNPKDDLKRKLIAEIKEYNKLVGYKSDLIVSAYQKGYKTGRQQTAQRIIDLLWSRAKEDNQADILADWVFPIIRKEFDLKGDKEEIKQKYLGDK